MLTQPRAATTPLLTAYLTVAAVLTLLLGAAPARGACPVGTVVSVDNDTPGSGYSEVKPNNWIAHNVGACKGTYRYLSHTVGDGTRKGKAIWTPTITYTGWYDVTVSFRASVNRTTDADYVVEQDGGAAKSFVINQQQGTDCTKKKLANVYCKAGGGCRVTLDGTDDGASDAADVTTFTLTKCTGTPPPPKACAGISANPNYELCSQTATTCAGVFKNSAGCVAFCAAAGGTCTASYGGEPGCKKEANTPLSCTATTGHASDWCECAIPTMPDAGPTPTKDQGAPTADVGGTTDLAALDAAAVDSTAPGIDGGALPVDAAADGPTTSPGASSISGGCAVGGGGSGAALALLLLLLALALQRRSKR